VSSQPVYVLTLQAEHEEVHGLRALLKRLIRDHGLKCIDVHELEKEEVMSDDLFDYNDAEKQRDFTVAQPDLYWLRVEVRPGAVADDHLLPAKNGYTWHLSVKATVRDGEYAGAVAFDYITLKFDPTGASLVVPVAPPPQQAEKYKTAVRMGRGKLRTLLESAFAIDPDDDSEEANAKRRIKDNDFLNLNGLVIFARVDIRKGSNGYKDSNTIDYIITFGMPEWPTPPQGNAVVSRAKDFDDEVPY
jgi:hypothetical protein